MTSIASCQISINLVGNDRAIRTTGLLGDRYETTGGGAMGVSITLIIVFIAIVAGVVGLWAYRRSASQPQLGPAKNGVKPPANGTNEAKSQVEQWGVRITASTREKACPQARQILGKEFPMDKKPQLPLPDCPYPRQCECHYTKLFDRRKEERRSGQERRQGGQRYESNSRRSGKDRRKKKSNIDWT
jgi:FtsZ-interacting cell division protein ZipA